MKRECPQCGGTNINPVGEYYQCQSKRGNPEITSCGYIGKSMDFNIRTATKLFNGKE